MAEEFTVEEITGPWVELSRVSHRLAVPIEKDSGIGQLRNFRLLGRELHILPQEVDENMAVRVFYYRRDESPAGEADLENEWMKEFPDLFIAEVGMRMAQDLEDASALRYFTAMRDEARRAYDEKVAEERHATEVFTF